MTKVKVIGLTTVLMGVKIAQVCKVVVVLTYIVLKVDSK